MNGLQTIAISLVIFPFVWTGNWRRLLWWWVDGDLEARSTTVHRKVSVIVHGVMVSGTATTSKRLENVFTGDRVTGAGFVIPLELHMVPGEGVLVLVVGRIGGLQRLIEAGADIVRIVLADGFYKRQEEGSFDVYDAGAGVPLA